jgi:hypothetical protein
MRIDRWRLADQAEPDEEAHHADEREDEEKRATGGP